MNNTRKLVEAVQTLMSKNLPITTEILEKYAAEHEADFLSTLSQSELQQLQAAKNGEQINTKTLCKWKDYMVRVSPVCRDLIADTECLLFACRFPEAQLLSAGCYEIYPYPTLSMLDGERE